MRWGFILILGVTVAGVFMAGSNAVHRFIRRIRQEPYDPWGSDE